jgi:hypothetical protein
MALHSLNLCKEINMSKSHNAHKQTKKQPMMTPKERRAAKMAKKHPQNIVIPEPAH